MNPIKLQTFQEGPRSFGFRIVRCGRVRASGHGYNTQAKAVRGLFSLVFGLREHLPWNWSDKIERDARPVKAIRRRRRRQRAAR